MLALIRGSRLLPAHITLLLSLCVMAPLKAHAQSHFAKALAEVAAICNEGALIDKDIDQCQRSIAALEGIQQRSELTSNEREAFTQTYGFALYNKAAAQFEQHKPIDKSEVRRSLVLIEKMVNRIGLENVSPVLTMVMLKAALRFLEDSELATKYARACAIAGDAHCSQFAASGALAGFETGKPDLQAAYKWYKLAISQQTDSDCTRLITYAPMSMLTFYFPDLDPAYPWTYWLAKVKAADQKWLESGAEPDGCSQFEVYLQAYVQLVSTKRDATEMLATLDRLAITAPQRELVARLHQPQSLLTVARQFNDKQELSHCYIQLSAALLSQQAAYYQAAEQGAWAAQLTTLAELHCDDVVGVIDLLQQAGKLPRH